MDSKNSRDYLEEEAMELTAIYIKDSKRYHVFQLEKGQGVIGNLYFPKGEKAIPDQLVVILKTPGENRGRQ